MRTQFQPVPPFRAHKLVAPANRYIPKFDEARALAEAIVETIREPLLVLDEELRIVTANRSFRRMFKVSRREVQGRPFYALGGGRWNIPELRFLLANVLPMDVCEVEADVPGIGRRTMQLNARKLFHERNDRALVLLTIEDISERRAGERQTAELLHQKETLLEEMQHRIANSLQIIASILLMKARAVQSEEARLYLKDTHQRIMSVAAMQQQLAIARHGEQIELGPYLSRLCETLAASLIGVSRPISIRAQADEARVPSAAAVSIGLVVTELVINALKHAFVADTAAGLIVVTYEVTESGWRLTVSDNGIGKSEGTTDKASPGLGTGIVEALAKQLEGRVNISMGSGGTTVSITHGMISFRLPHAA
ncbi:sensor histidine kinase [Nitratireductor luteus]|uniref:sensor histidine kinase n=1 Tax=Nitratireductor luteus TaxID=2976980 RepID=UPI0022406770|nr:PAS domain-containing sensor histidine kinase [Nitratireductor luteus]